ncbi:hypothetical protein NLX86_26455 [Streptomyces sp. A3M-1-3]|uniref:hypothetical protein n=1 Tax=Streptomyces sp. A3M-1-3 TaxID=2962044 RepID=UPI0020B85F45|nr:hypothetical protein [Streptomyces sp. A3M-1-3]MCP3821505.1 hypothetical protein [Streptomyces sp. A3M-1-3]
MISHATPRQRDVPYDHRAQQAALPVQLHHRDGTTEDTILVLTPSEVELFHLQLERAIDLREKAMERSVAN